MRAGEQGDEGYGGVGSAETGETETRLGRDIARGRMGQHVDGGKRVGTVEGAYVWPWLALISIFQIGYNQFLEYRLPEKRARSMLASS